MCRAQGRRPASCPSPTYRRAPGRAADLPPPPFRWPPPPRPRGPGPGGRFCGAGAPAPPPPRRVRRHRDLGELARPRLDVRGPRLLSWRARVDRVRARIDGDDRPPRGLAERDPVPPDPELLGARGCADTELRKPRLERGDALARDG